MTDEAPTIKTLFALAQWRYLNDPEHYAAVHIATHGLHTLPGYESADERVVTAAASLAIVVAEHAFGPVPAMLLDLGGALDD